jgi:hypothetical protein
MSTPETIKTQLRNLISNANAITRKQDSDITQAVNSLISGYGTGDSTEAAKEEQEKAVTITENGTTEVTPDSGKTLSKVTVNVNVESGGAGDNEVLIGILDGSATDVVFPNGLKTIRSRACMYHASLTSIVFPSDLETIGTNAFSACSLLNSIVFGDSLYRIYGYAFENCTALTKLSLPSSLRIMDGACFNKCTALAEVRFNSTPTTINATAFNNCTALADIYVPWAEGEVANAPWGATNATIHYNTTN